MGEPGRYRHIYHHLCSYIIRRRVYGNMAGLEDDDSLDSDSDMLLDGECLNDDDDDIILLGGNYY